jgi:hypothetical protein
MSTEVRLEQLLVLLHGDEELLSHLRRVELLPQDVESFSSEDAEIARVAGTLVHELEVNLSGVEVVLRMRSELVTTRRQLALTVRKLRAHEED